MNGYARADQSSLFPDAGPKFNREMLILARESRGLTQSDLASRLGMAQATVSKIENGLQEPNAQQLKAFAKCLGFREGFFFFRQQMRRFGSACTYHRARKKTTESRMRQLLGIINIRRIQIGNLLGSVELMPENEFIRLDVDEYESTSHIARMMRTTWKLPPGPIQNLTRGIEDAGGIVVRCDFGTRDVDALSQYLPEGVPLFLVNACIPEDRLRYTLAHEVGHLIMHHMQNDDMEKQADEFAAEFLMPEEEIRADLVDVTLPKLAILKGYWKVSMSALLKRAGDLNLISPRKRQFLWTQMGKQGYRSQEPVLLPKEEPTLLREMLNTYMGDLGYSERELGDLVGENEDRIEDVYLPRKYGLRVVNSF